MILGSMATMVHGAGAMPVTTRLGTTTMAGTILGTTTMPVGMILGTMVTAGAGLTDTDGMICGGHPTITTTDIRADMQAQPIIGRIAGAVSTALRGIHPVMAGVPQVATSPATVGARTTLVPTTHGHIR